MRCWPWGVFSSWLASRDALQLLGVSGTCGLDNDSVLSLSQTNIWINDRSQSAKSHMCCVCVFVCVCVFLCTTMASISSDGLTLSQYVLPVLPLSGWLSESNHKPLAWGPWDLYTENKLIIKDVYIDCFLTVYPTPLCKSNGTFFQGMEFNEFISVLQKYKRPVTKCYVCTCCCVNLVCVRQLII